MAEAANAVTADDMHRVVLGAIADTLERALRIDDGCRYIVIDDALARDWAQGIRKAIEAQQAK